MLLRGATASSSPSFSLLNANGDRHLVPLFSSSSSSSYSLAPLNSSSSLASAILRYSQGKSGGGLVVPCAAAKGGSNSKPLSGVVFEPFEEVKKELDLVPTVPQASLARQKYVNECEAAVNEQIKCVPPSSSFKVSSFLIFLTTVFFFHINFIKFF